MARHLLLMLARHPTGEAIMETEKLGTYNWHEQRNTDYLRRPMTLAEYRAIQKWLKECDLKLKSLKEQTI